MKMGVINNTSCFSITNSTILDSHIAIVLKFNCSKLLKVSRIYIETMNQDILRQKIAAMSKQSKPSVATQEEKLSVKEEVKLNQIVT